jgi:hypothetical protein
VGKLLAPLERTLRASAGLLHDLVRVDRALQLRNAFDDRFRVPSDEAPAVTPVALTSFASRPLKVRIDEHGRRRPWWEFVRWEHYFQSPTPPRQRRARASASLSAGASIK